LHTPQRHWLPVYLLTGSTPYGYLDHATQVDWCPLKCSQHGGIDFADSTGTDMDALSEFEVELVARLIQLNAHTAMIQLSRRLPTPSHVGLQATMTRDMAAYGQSVGRKDTCFEVVVESGTGSDMKCCTIRRNSASKQIKYLYRTCVFASWSICSHEFDLYYMLCRR
jgi:hypothetical protein